jgi:hypothetical protein
MHNSVLTVATDAAADADDDDDAAAAELLRSRACGDNLRYYPSLFGSLNTASCSLFSQKRAKLSFGTALIQC